MVITILVSNGSFHSVEYNQQKVEQGSAELLEMKNFGYLQMADEVTTADLQQYLKDYSHRNSHIKKPQFHVAISCKEREYTFNELLDIGHKYLHEMGYDNEGQPLLIYGHHDTDNNHIHIITSRVAPDGHKIDHNNEKKRSVEVMNHIMGIDETACCSENVKEALKYRYSSVSQFRAILECQGYACNELDDHLEIRRNGETIDKVKLADIEAHQSNWKLDKYTKRRIKALLMKFRDFSADKDDLAKQMHRYFGMSLVFFGKADSPYGYMIVDHKNKVVIKGSDVFPIKQLLQFRSAEDRFQDIDSTISTLLENHPSMTTKELRNHLHRKFHAKLTKEGSVWGETTHALSDEIRSKLESNDKLAWLQSFRPASDVECAILYRFGKIDDPQGITPVSPNAKKIQKSVSMVKSIMDKTSNSKLKDKFFESGIRVYRVEGRYYCLDIQNQSIFCMNDQKLNIDMLDQVYGTPKRKEAIQAASPTQLNVGRVLGSLLTKSGGSGNENRENEVGSRSNYDQIDDERTLKR
jgi:hypothetical protein